MKTTISSQILADPRLDSAISQIQEIWSEYSSQITEAQSTVKLDIEYQKLLDDCSQARGAQLFFPYLGSGFGKGAYVELADASIKLDFISGIGVHWMGHGNKEFLACQIKAALSDTIMQGHLQQNDNQSKLMQKIVSLAQKNGANLDHCFVTSSGAMANENAMKIAFQNKFPANRVLAFSRGFSGRTIGLAQITDKHVFRAGLPKTLEVDYIPFYDHNDPDGSLAKSIAAFDEHHRRFPGQHAFFCGELIQGEGGYFSGNQEYFHKLFSHLKEKGMLIWIDEVQSFGRCDEPFAFQHFKLDEVVDLVTFGKMTQVCGTLFGSKIKPKAGLISQTFTSANSAIEAGHFIIDKLTGNEICGPEGKIAQLSHKFAQGLDAIGKANQQKIRGPYGIGSMWAFSVLDESPEVTKKFCHRLFKNGLMSFIAGSEKARIRMLPPMGVLTEDELNEALKIIEKTLEEF